MREIWNHIKAAACKFYKWLNDRLVFVVWAISFALLIGFGFALALFGYAKLFGGMSASPPEVLRDIALTVVAILGFPLLLQRTRALDKQAESALIQAKTDSTRRLAEAFAQAANLFASAELSLRLAGLYALWKVAKEDTENHHVQIMQILCAFIRNPPELKGWKLVDGKLPAQRPDIESVLTLILGRGEKQWQQEFVSNYRLDFRGADLCGVRFSGAYLRRANFMGAQLQSADFMFSDLRFAQFQRANLCMANFSYADIRGASFSDATVGENPPTMWTKAAMNGADMSISGLQDKDLKRGVILTDDDGRDLHPMPSIFISLIEVKDFPRLTLQEWEKKRGKKAIA